MGFPGGTVVKNPPANAEDSEDLGSIRCPRVRNGNPFQYSCPKNPMDRGAWGCKESDMTEQALNAQ